MDLLTVYKGVNVAQKEAKARLKINMLLSDAGWRLLDDENGPANVDVENKVDISNPGDDFENVRRGFVDYLLLDSNQKPIAVLEAKRESIPPLSAKEQARDYANSLHVRYVILSNGNTHYLWDMQFGNPEPISSFPSLSSLEDEKKWVPDVDALANEEVSKTYIAESQMPEIKTHPDYINEDTRKEFIEKNKLKILRNYQVNAIKAVQKSAGNGKKRFLLEMATGTGKTLTCAAIIKLFLKTGNAQRILFLVDRIELENQAKKSFNQSIGKDYIVKVWKEDRDNWRTADIVISTVQSLLASSRYRDFSPNDFDLIISDEAHRSIGGNARAVFEYFTGYKIGLTATPKDFLKNTKQEANSEREFERRELLDTYRTFGCESGQPTFRYDLKDGVNDPDGPFLVNPVILDARTNITSQLLADEGYAVHRVIDGEDVDENFGIRDFEKTFFNEETNHVFCETFMKYAAKDPLSGEIGKTIIFTVSQKHAEKIVQILNQIAMEQFPGKYNSDFAIQITSNVRDAQQFSINFSENNLLGHTRWLPDYESSRARVAVTVGMMTTGYDCSDLLNLVFMRPVFSPSDFIQMKGRGTRLHTFKFVDYSNNEKTIEIRKENFRLIDFFAVCEYFEEKYDYNAPLVVPAGKSQGVTITPPVFGPGTPPPDIVVTRGVELGEDDELRNLDKTIVGKEGMRVDREMFRSFQDEVKSNEEFVKLYNDGNIDEALSYLKTEILGEDKPKFYMTPEKIRKIFNLDRRLDLREILDLIMNNKEPLTKAQYIQQKFNEFIADKNLSEELVGDMYNDAFELFDAYITNRRVAEAIDEKNFSLLAGFGSLSMRQLLHLGGERIDQITEYIRDYINVEKLRVKD